MSGATGGAGQAAAGGTPAREGQTIAGTSRAVAYANFVRLPHTLFALPFALVGVTLGSFRVDVTAKVVWWVVVAFTAARFAAMGFNRIVDREYDRRNPRTAMRELATGAMTLREASVAVTMAAAIFLVAARLLNPICFALAPVALAWVFCYSYTKRFTRWSHLVLGAGLGIAPVGGYLAVTGQWSDPWWMLVSLAGAVTLWVGGFDVIYALQDVAVDRAEGLHSLPAAVGDAVALLFARAMHAAAAAGLVVAGLGANAGLLYFVGVVVAGLLLVKEHQLVRDASHQKAFFAINATLSSLFLVFVLLDRMYYLRAGWLQ
jgi:4-hydroxybenzoate polyprenyltransferase